MIDLHCHVLPGIDDGPQSFEQAVEMCRLAAAAGCDGLFPQPDNASKAISGVRPRSEWKIGV